MHDHTYLERNSQFFALLDFLLHAINDDDSSINISYRRLIIEKKTKKQIVLLPMS